MSRFSAVRLLRAPIFPYPPLWKEVTSHSSHRRSREHMHPFWIFWNISAQKSCLFSSSYFYSIISCIRTDLWIFIFSVGLESNALLFCCSSCSDFGHWETFIGSCWSCNFYISMTISANTLTSNAGRLVH